MNKMSSESKVIIVISLIILFYTIIDKIFLTLAEIGFVTFPSMTNTVYWIFMMIVFLIFITPTVSILLFRDRNSLIVWFSVIFLILGGLEDILFFILFLNPIPSSMDWLFNAPQGLFSKYFLQLNTVTPVGLIMNLVLFSTVLAFVVFFIKYINVKGN